MASAIPGIVWPLAIALGLLAFVVILKAVAGGGGPKGEFRYTRAPALLTEAELRFHGALKGALGDQFVICPKVRLADVLEVSRGLPKAAWQGAFARISQKHLDFVLCQPRTFEIVAAVELDDRSHSESKRRERDDFLNNALAAAEVPLVRFPASNRYDLATLAGEIESALVGPRPENAKASTNETALPSVATGD